MCELTIKLCNVFKDPKSSNEDKISVCLAIEPDHMTNFMLGVLVNEQDRELIFKTPELRKRINFPLLVRRLRTDRRCVDKKFVHLPEKMVCQVLDHFTDDEFAREEVREKLVDLIHSSLELGRLDVFFGVTDRWPEFFDSGDHIVGCINVLGCPTSSKARLLLNNLILRLKNQKQGHLMDQDQVLQACGTFCLPEVKMIWEIFWQHHPAAEPSDQVSLINECFVEAVFANPRSEVMEWMMEEYCGFLDWENALISMCPCPEKGRRAKVLLTHLLQSLKSQT